MASSSISLIVTSVCLDSASSPVNIALKYGLHALKITLCAKIFLDPTFNTTSHSSLWRLRRFSSVSVFFGCLSDVWDSLAGDGGRSPTAISPILQVPRMWETSWSRKGGDAQPHTESICKCHKNPILKISIVFIHSSYLIRVYVCNCMFGTAYLKILNLWIIVWCCIFNLIYY